MSDIQIPGTLPTVEKMRRMMMVAQMRSTADASGMGFIGGWMDEETGEVFFQTNVDQPEDVNNFLRGILPSNAQLPGNNQ